MLVGVVPALGTRRYAAAAPPPPSTSTQNSTQRWCHRQGSPTLARTQPAQVVRQRRATVATASSEATSAWDPLPDATPAGVRRLSRPPEVQRLAQRLLPEEPEFVSRMPSPLPSLWRDKYELCQDSPALGGGAFAEVFKVQHRLTLECFAVKVMHRPNFALRGIEKQIEAEITAMRMAAEAARSGRSEGHIVQLLDVAEECDYVYLLLELCEQGDLLRKLNAEPLQRFREDVGAMWARQLLLGLKTLHRLGFLHRDIKPDNLLCTAGSVLKIADFGWCSLLEEAPTCLAGTFQYMAPEVLHNMRQTEAVDVWSAGVALHQMLVGKPLLTTYLGPGATGLTECDPHKATAVKQRRLLEEIKRTCPPSYDRRPPHLSSMCWDFLRQLLIPEADHRTTIDGALRHPWLKLAAGSTNSEVASNVEMEETSPPRNHSDKLTEVPPSPPCSKIKENLSPSTDRSPNSIDNVPTPLKPRSWDPNRNIAYTPPVSPERKACGLMPVQDCHDQTQPVRTPLSRLSPPAPPPRALGRRLGGSVIIARSSRGGAFDSPAAEGDGPLLLSGSASALLRQPRFDHTATNNLLRKLHSCNEQLRQIQSAMLSSERKLQGLDSAHDMDYAGEPMMAVESVHRVLHDLDPINSGYDVLTATAPPLIGASTPGLHVPSRGVLDKSSRSPTEGLQSARGRENVLPPNPVVSSCGSTSLPWKGKPMVRNGMVCYTAAPRYAPLASPAKASATSGPPPPAASRITQGSSHQQGQRYLLAVPTPGVPQVPIQATAAMWPQTANTSPLQTSGTETRSGVMPRRGRASVAGQWVQACDTH